MKSVLLAALFAVLLTAQTKPPAPAAPTEDDNLRQALGEAGNSPIDFIRALENHLQKYPNTTRLLELQRALVKVAFELKDDDRIVKYGQAVLKHDPDDAQILEHVATSLLRKGGKENAAEALKLAKHLQDLLQSAVNGQTEAKIKDGADRSNARALILQARAEGLLEEYPKASDLAELSFSIYPSVEAARESSRWLAAMGKNEEAVRYLAKAFTISELKSTDTDAVHDRVRMGELYKQWKGSETGLGDLILQEYDHTSAAFSARRQELRKLDPNADAKEPAQFTLSGVLGDKLALASLKGKVIVLDFWATWCGPCRLQHPLYEEVKKRFKERDDVVFLAIDTDEEHALVKPFLEQNKWNPKVYFEDGLGSMLQVTSIPTTVILNKQGAVSSRMNGFLPDRFVDMLSDRIKEALD
jgi:thiol-disulfide isomerase/thioredoxin